MIEAIRYFTPDRADFASLRAMARAAFADAFDYLYDAAPFSHFLEQAYGPGGTMERDLGDASIRWLVAASGGPTMINDLDRTRPHGCPLQ